jgi:hypothetical protein
MDWLFGRFLLLALCALPLTACAEQHGDREVEQPPFYVHFSAGIPLEEREVWGEAAAELNAPIFAATGQYMYWVASGPAGDLCGVEVRHGGELAIERDRCLTVIVYDELDLDVARLALEELAGTP